jgi:hypothetical protein
MCITDLSKSAEVPPPPFAFFYSLLLALMGHMCALFSSQVL